MRTYIIKRILLMIPTLIGLTIITFFLLQFVPGGPAEVALMKLQSGQMQGSESSTTFSNSKLTESALQKMKEFYGFD
ncbi:MAG: microcin ABC transporter permease, partial [Ignavibacteriota bacterium]